MHNLFFIPSIFGTHKVQGSGLFGTAIFSAATFDTNHLKMFEIASVSKTTKKDNFL